MQLGINYYIIESCESDVKALSSCLTNLNSTSTIYSSNDLIQSFDLLIKNEYQAVFMDIKLFTGNEYLIKTWVRKSAFNLFIVIMSYNNEDALSAIRYRATDFLKKPIKKADVLKVIHHINTVKYEKEAERKLRTQSQNSNYNKKVKLISHRTHLFFDPTDILFLQAKGNYTNCYLANSNSHLITSKIGHLEQLLPSDQFFRINRSILVNLKYIYLVNNVEKICKLKYSDKEYDFSIPANRLKEFNEMFSQ